MTDREAKRESKAAAAALVESCKDEPEALSLLVHRRWRSVTQLQLLLQPCSTVVTAAAATAAAAVTAAAAAATAAAATDAADDTKRQRSEICHRRR